jgi:hypothetical protein
LFTLVSLSATTRTTKIPLSYCWRVRFSFDTPLCPWAPYSTTYLSLQSTLYIRYVAANE